MTSGVIAEAAGSRHACVMTDGASALAVVQTYADAWLSGDLVTVLGSYHRELTLTWPGTHRLAGVYQGLDASLTALASLQEVTARQPIVVHDITDTAGRISLDVTERWIDGDGAATDVRRTMHFTVADDLLHTCEVVESAPQLVDDWLGRARPAS